MECEGHVQLGGLETLGGKQTVRRLNDLNSTAQDSFLRTVHTSNLRHIRSKSFLDRLNAALDSKHAVGVGGAFLLKDLSTTANKKDHVTGRDDTSNMKSGVFA